ncbi:MAG: ribosome biogenesis GTP-binding protein YihA/YsxC [Bacteroidetes bacterium]|nr:ribosome biogenesis GTP-binding protein YihA/YsxC [Bacteroidota bacterium]
MFIKTSSFVLSSTDVMKCPKPEYPEYAFLGRSNVGKSSLINMLLERKNLARISADPGKTRLINHFMVNNEWYLVDLPGLGYARVAKGKKREWLKMITAYLLKRESLLNLFYLVDARLEPQTIDVEFINWLGYHQIPFTLVYTKTDKVTANELALTMKFLMKKLSETWKELPMIIQTSSKTKSGRDDILQFIENTNPIFRINRESVN